MLQVTDAAASVFRAMLQLEEVSGSAVRLMPTAAPQGMVGVTMQPVEGPAPDDTPAEAAGVDVYVAPELAEPLAASTLDARDTAEGPELFIRPTEA
jgi:Fe-S cluster assembly iron-binding protein IscA